MVTGAPRLVSVSATGVQANGASSAPAISADGRFVVFSSRANNLIRPRVTHVRDVFIHNPATGVTRLVSQSSAGVEGNQGSVAPALSPNGRFVVFVSAAWNLVRNDKVGTQDVFVRDLTAGTTHLVSRAADGGLENGRSGHPAVTAGSRWIVFGSAARNLVTGDGNGFWDVFARGPYA